MSAATSSSTRARMPRSILRRSSPAPLSATNRRRVAQHPKLGVGFCLAGAMVLGHPGRHRADAVRRRLFITALDHARLRPVSTILIGLVTLILVRRLPSSCRRPLLACRSGWRCCWRCRCSSSSAIRLPRPASRPAFRAQFGAGRIARGLLFNILGTIIIGADQPHSVGGALAVAVVVVLGVGALGARPAAAAHARARRPVPELPHPAPQPRHAAPPPFLRLRRLHRSQSGGRATAPEQPAS